MDDLRGRKRHKEKHDEPIVKEGMPIILFLFACAIVSIFLGWMVLAFVMIFLGAFTMWFFRNPQRIVTGGDEIVSSPADGTVIGIEKGVTHELLGTSATKISIFMNLFNVHVNRVPCDGQVEVVRYYPGKFFSAHLDKASHDNERNAVLIKRRDGKKVLTVQIAGLIARRIACWVEEGMEVSRGERLGLIRFGSRLEVYLPPEAVIAVKRGDKVKAGETSLGELL
ncbi:MAG: phosphatidylserine decarboxylase family protein [Syntrophales bacterium]|nr:phosphatidylserine decarboxylase family protein [Syntrophales bacterium]